MENQRLLFVDDEEELVTTVVERLELRGIESVGVTSGNEALDLLRDGSFGVVIMDVKMPGIGGLEVLRTVTQRHPEVKVVLMTGHGSTEDREIGRRLGAVAYLQKPIDLEDLLVTIRRAVKSPEEKHADER